MLIQAIKYFDVFLIGMVVGVIFMGLATLRLLDRLDKKRENAISKLARFQAEQFNQR